jgi:hypothetical protein
MSGMNATGVVDVVSNSGAWDAGMPLVVDACNAGRDDNGIGSQVAAGLGVFVTAPTSFTWSNTIGYFGGDTTGTGSYNKVFGMAVPNITLRMPWQTFGPDGTPTSKTPIPPGR